MAPTIRGLVPITSLTKEQRNAAKRGKKFRGEFLEQIIQIESRLEYCIELYLNSPHKNKVWDFFHFYFFVEETISLGFKISMLKRIVELSQIDDDAFKDYFELITYLNRLRTYVAHFPIDYKNVHEISFYKRALKYKGDDSQPKGEKNIKRIKDDTTKIKISEQAIKDIGLQLKISFQFLYTLMEFFSDEEEREYKIPSERLVKLHSKVKKEYLYNKDKLGVFSIGLPQ